MPIIPSSILSVSLRNSALLDPEIAAPQKNTESKSGVFSAESDAAEAEITLTCETGVLFLFHFSLKVVRVSFVRL
jgi:hypothetical protein